MRNLLQRADVGIGPYAQVLLQPWGRQWLIIRGLFCELAIDKGWIRAYTDNNK